MHTHHQTIMIYSLEIYHSENSQQLLDTDLLNDLDIFHRIKQITEFRMI